MGYKIILGMLLVFGPQWVNIYFPSLNMVPTPLVVIGLYLISRLIYMICEKINNNIIYNHSVHFLALMGTKKGNIKLSGVFELRPETGIV